MKKLNFILLVLCFIFLVVNAELNEFGFDINDHKPVFSLPVSDIENGNDIESVYYDIEYDKLRLYVEITVVFKDEDHPNGLIDWIYDMIRKRKYKRIEDVETFFLNLYINDRGYVSLSNVK